MSLAEAVQKDRATVLAEERTQLAIERTRVAEERTLMAWIRTALSMIGFGFTIVKFFQYMPEDLANGTIRRPQASRNLGMTLIALGTLALAAAAWQHRKRRREQERLKVGGGADGQDGEPASIGQGGCCLD